jgi:hypothetical protein
VIDFHPGGASCLEETRARPCDDPNDGTPRITQISGTHWQRPIRFRPERGDISNRRIEATFCPGHAFVSYAASVKMPYIVISIALGLLAVAIAMLKLPKIEPATAPLDRPAQIQTEAL